MLFGLWSGLRRGELLSLTWADFNEAEKTISVTKTLNRVKTYNESGNKTKLVVSEPKTEKSKRVIPLIDKAFDLLLTHKVLQDEYINSVGEFYQDNNLIFSSNLGTYIEPRNLNRKLNEVIEELKLPHLTPHSLRHSFATRGFEAEISLKAMQEILGHSSVTVTGNIYTHVLMDQKRKELNKLNEFLKEEDI